MLGLVAGSAGIVVAQQRWLPERLSAQESARLRVSVQQLEAERDRLRGELAAAAGERDAVQAEQESLQRERDALKARAAAWDEDLGFLIDVLPADPRDGVVAVRGARALLRDGVLHYGLAMSHEGRPVDGVLTLTAEGRSRDGRSQRVELAAANLRVAGRHIERGEAALPAGFVPEQVTLRIVERAGGRSLGMRVVRVRGS